MGTCIISCGLRKLWLWEPKSVSEYKLELLHIFPGISELPHPHLIRLFIEVVVLVFPGNRLTRLLQCEHEGHSWNLPNLPCGLGNLWFWVLKVYEKMGWRLHHVGRSQGHIIHRKWTWLQIPMKGIEAFELDFSYQSRRRYTTNNDKRVSYIISGHACTIFEHCLY